MNSIKLLNLIVLTKVLTRIKRNGGWPAIPDNDVLNKVLPCSDESAEEAEQRYLDAPRHKVPDRRDDVPLLLPPRHLRLARQTEDGVNLVMPKPDRRFEVIVYGGTLLGIYLKLLTSLFHYLL